MYLDARFSAYSVLDAEEYNLLAPVIKQIGLEPNHPAWDEHTKWPQEALDGLASSH